MRREFTGKHMLIVLVAGFGIVVAVNFFMAHVAARSFNGVVVENSYIASQKFNDLLNEAREQDALGWSAQLSRDPATRLLLITQNVPANATVHVELRHPLGYKAVQSLDLLPASPGTYVSEKPVGEGRWIARVEIMAEGERWLAKEELQ